MYKQKKKFLKKKFLLKKRLWKFENIVMIIINRLEKNQMSSLNNQYVIKHYVVIK